MKLSLGYEYYTLQWEIDTQQFTLDLSTCKQLEELNIFYDLFQANIKLPNTHQVHINLTIGSKLRDDDDK